MDDRRFFARFFELDGNASALAREVGMSDTGVRKRIQRLDSLVADYKAGTVSSATAAIVAAVEATKRSEVCADGFKGGVQQVRGQYHIFDHLEDLFMDVKSLLDDVKKDISDAKARNKSIKPYQIDQVVNLVNQSRNLVKDAHKIKIELAQAKHVEAFIQAVTAIAIKYDPAIREKLYVELSGLGVEGQIAFLAANH